MIAFERDLRRVNNWRRCRNCFPKWPHRVTFSSATCEGSPLSTKLVIVCIFYSSPPGGYEVVSHCGFDFYGPNINDVEHVFMSLLTICVFSLVRCLFKSIAYFRIGLLPLVFLMGSTLVCQEAQRARGMHGQKALLEISREGMGEAGGTG